MDNHYFIYDNDAYFAQGMATLLEDEVGKPATRCAWFNDFNAMLEALEASATRGGKHYLLCDISRLPVDRFTAINALRRLCLKYNARLAVLLPAGNMPLFFALYSLLPDACWLLKSEPLADIAAFLRALGDPEAAKSNKFSRSLVNYTRQYWLSGDLQKIISSDDLWLMGEIFKGKSLTQIAYEVKSDVRRLSYHKRRLMKKTNALNNADLVRMFRNLIGMPNQAAI